MRYGVWIALLLIGPWALAQDPPVGQVVSQQQGTLIHNIVMEGFVLGDKDQFIKLFKPYRNKYLSTQDMDAILQKIQDIYQLNGYQQLVSVSYRVDKHRLVFTALMIS
jgi:hypothetical protein